MRSLLLIAVLGVLSGFSSVHAQIRISGFVKDSLSGERLLGAHVLDVHTGNGVITDNSGYFNIAVKVQASLRISYIGYHSLELHFHNAQDTVINIVLAEDAQLEEVVVSGKVMYEPFVSSLSSKELSGTPALGGKPDVLKTIQLLPGIFPQNEGSSRLLVRGGSPGQNLYLIDDIPLIYVNHLGGFTSVFNPDIINKAAVYKSGFPAKYGGKLSSIVAISQNEGDISGFRGSFSLGVTDASLTLEGPTAIKNSSYIVTARKTLIEPLMALASGLPPDASYIIAYGYHDVNAKFSWKPSVRNSLHVNLYQGDDYLNYWSKNSESETGKNRLSNGWGNWLGSVRWSSIASSKLYGTTSLSYSRYRLKEKQMYSFADDLSTSFENKYLSSVQDLFFRSDWNYELLRRWSVNFGLQASHYTHLPNHTSRSGQSDRPEYDRIHSLESAIYLDNEFRLPYNSVVNLGGRIVRYGTKEFSDLSFEPRLRVSAGISRTQTVNLSYMKVNQYAHLLFTQGSIMNNDVWVPANAAIPKAFTDHYSVGWTGSFLKERWQLSLDAYWKRLHQLSTYKEGFTSLKGDADWRSKIVSGGVGTAKGVEVMLKKGQGAWTGFLTYALSNTRYRFPQINGGRSYLFEYDRPHSASLSIGRKLGDKWSLNLTWIYQTGLPYTPATGRQLVPETTGDGYYEALIYGDRNSDRMRDYHRLDVGLVYRTVSKKRKLPVEWTFSVYNAYNRQNPYHYYYNTKAGDEIIMPELEGEIGALSMHQASFFPVIPTVSYKIFFDKASLKRTANKRTLKQRVRKLFYYE